MAGNFYVFMMMTRRFFVARQLLCSNIHSVPTLMPFTVTSNEPVEVLITYNLTFQITSTSLQ